MEGMAEGRETYEEPAETFEACAAVEMADAVGYSAVECSSSGGGGTDKGDPEGSLIDRIPEGDEVDNS